MKKSIEEQIIERILSSPAEETNKLAMFSDIYDDGESLYLIESFKIWLSFLKNEKTEFLGLEDMKKILNNLRKLLVQKINIISKTGENFYELTILLLALESITENSIFESNKELVKNDKVLLSYNLAMLIVDGSNREEATKWFNEDLKKLRFN